MELQTTESDDGSWATENVTFQTLPSADQPQATAPEDGLTPKCGLLTRTVIESPVVQWILPVRLRSATHNDVAFIGVRSALKLLSFRLPYFIPYVPRDCPREPSTGR